VKRWIKPAMIALLGMALSSGSVGTGMDADDLLHAQYFHGVISGQAQQPFWDLFKQVPANPMAIHGGIRIGVLPWWTWPGLQISFFRTISATTHYLDHLLWPNSPALMHIHSLVWYGLLCFLVTILLRRILIRPWVAGLAALIFAVDEAHAVNVGWIACRNALIAAVFCVLCLLAHDRWRRDGWQAGAWIAPPLLALSLLSAEMGVTTVVFLACYGLLLESGPLRARLLSLVPALAVLAGWITLYYSLGYGCFGSDLYIHPLQDPGGFLAALPGRLQHLTTLQLGLPPTVILRLYWLLGPHAFLLALVTAVVVFLTVCWVVLLRLRRDRTLRFWAIAFALSLPLLASSLGHPRLLLIASLPAAALIARTLAELFGPQGPRLLARPAAVIVALIHLAAAPLVLVIEAGPPGLPLGELAEIRAGDLDHVPDLQSKQLIVINAPNIYHGMLIPVTRGSAGKATPLLTFIWSTTLAHVDITRVDERTLDLSSEHWFFGDPIANNYRGRANPLKVGQRLPLFSHLVQVMELMPDDRPRRVRFRFVLPLEQDHTLVMLSHDGWRYARFRPPRPGVTVRLYGNGRQAVGR